MSRPSFTPGPWAVNPSHARVDAMPSTLPVCELLWPTQERSESETGANAVLIAAAPELYEALSNLVQMHAMPGEDPHETFERVSAKFQAETGILAPGKDDRSGAMNNRERADAYGERYQKTVAAAFAALTAAGYTVQP